MQLAPLRKDWVKLAGWLTPAGVAEAAWPTERAALLRTASLIQRTGLAGQVLDAARQAGCSLPPELETSLQRPAHLVAASNLAMLSELPRLLAALTGAGVPAVLLKGAALHHTLYTRPDQRPMTDVDLLVRPEQAWAAVAALEQAGCRRGADLLHPEMFPRFDHELEMFGPPPVKLRIDLHARPFRPRRLAHFIATDTLWHDAQPIDVQGETGYVLSPEVMLLHLAAHAGYHGCSRLVWLVDIWRWAMQYGKRIDWDRLIARAGDWRIALPAATAFRATARYLGEAWPADVTQRLQRQPASWADRAVLRHAPRDAAAPVTHALLDLASCPSWSYRLGLLRKLASPGDQHLASLYTGRHWGWRTAARLWRLLRPGWRAVRGGRLIGAR